jgi:hypothetical protein
VFVSHYLFVLVKKYCFFSRTNASKILSVQYEQLLLTVQYEQLVAENLTMDIDVPFIKVTY